MTPQPFVARNSPVQMVMLAIICVVMVGGAIALLVAADGDPFAYTFGVLGIVIFGGLLAFALRFVTRGDEPVIEVDQRGLLWTRWSQERIPWAAFERAALRSMRRQKFLALWLRDPAAHRSTHPLGWIARANKLIGFGDIALSAESTDRSYLELVEAVMTFAPQLFDED